MEEQKEKQNEHLLTKQCPHCKADIPASAKKCSQCGSDLRAWPYRHPILIAAAIIVVILILLTLVGAAQQPTNTPTNTAGTSSNSQQSPCSDLASLKKQAKTIDYKALNKDPNSFKGQVAQFTGQIAQIQESNGEGIIRLAVTKDALLGWSPSDIVYVTYHQHTDAVQDDVVTVYGTLTGSETYTSQANFQITIPSLDACIIEKQGAASAAGSKSSTPSATKQPTNQTPPTQQQSSTTAPATLQGSWHTVYTYNNNVALQTPSFPLKGTQERITYSCTITDNSNSYGATFNGILDSATGGFGGGVFAQEVNCPTNNVSYVYSQTPGQYYLDLNSYNATYTVTVEDYY